MLGKSESVSTKYILLVYQAAVALLPAPDAAYYDSEYGRI